MGSEKETEGFLNHHNTNQKSTLEHETEDEFRKEALEQRPLGVCGWIGIIILAIVFLFELGYLIYEFATWNQIRLNEYG